jgi:hypothetical protein
VLRFLIAALFVISGSAQAASLLVNDRPYGTFAPYTYNGEEATQFSAYLDAAFDTVVVGGFNDLTAMNSYDAIWVSTGSYNDALSAQEMSNLATYASSGGRLFLQGENGSWGTWNPSIVGLTDATLDISSGVVTATLNAVGNHELVTGISNLQVLGSGSLSSLGSGTALFDVNVAGVWADNVFMLMDVNALEDDVLADLNNDNDLFAQNVAQWLATGTVVPVPAAVWLFGSALAGLGFVRRRTSE